jgi:hypothetical protein
MDVALFNDGSVRGGILTTDISTRPFEFRVTSPIKPTHMQEVLYGASLKAYVYGELICAPLMQATKEKVTLAIVKDGSLLAMRPMISCPIGLISQNDKSISTHPDFDSEIEQIQTILSSLLKSEQIDLFEPFERLQTALNEIHQLNIGGQGKLGG